MKLWYSHSKQIKLRPVATAGLKFCTVSYQSDISGYQVELGHLPLCSLGFYALSRMLNFAI